MTLITTTAELADFCQRQEGADYVTVDTEFLRETTYWPKLCLVQVGGPAEAAAIDPLVPGLDLTPLWRLLNDVPVLKVLHSGRQDIEIFWKATGRIPTPLFDTQIAAMVCGFGESVGYEALVTRLTHAHLDKDSRFTDWSKRPLTDRQLRYALGDVIHLRPVYERLREQIAREGREAWLEGEHAVLANPATYANPPDDAWERIKVRSDKPKFLAVLREVAAWREREAQRRDLPRQRVVRDEALVEIASQAPTTEADLQRTRGLSDGFVRGKMGVELLAAVRRGLEVPREAAPRPAARLDLPQGSGPLLDLLKLLLRLKGEQAGVAPRLIAGAADLEAIVLDDAADVPALRGWRRDLFGEDALALKHGRLWFGVADGRIVVRRDGGEAP